MKTFTLNENQLALFRKWNEKHLQGHAPIKEATGAYLKFSFIPTGMGDVAKVECLFCDQSCSLSDEADAIT